MRNWLGKLTLLALLVAPGVLPLQAETLVVEYSSFYSHTRKLNKEATQDLQFAFGFKHVTEPGLCDIDQAFIDTPKKQIPLLLNNNRFVVPSEKALKLANAKVVIELQQAANRCDMSVQLETKPELLHLDYSKAQLAHIYQQYQAFFDKMGSFLSFLMPKVTGLKLQFGGEQHPSPDSGLLWQAPYLFVEEKWLQKGQALPLERKPLRIVAVVD